jgi:dTDP-glucose 4,6-dehydratase
VRLGGVDPALIVNNAAIPGEQRRSVLDAGKAAKELGWKPAMDLVRGLDITYRWFAANREQA